MPVRLNSSAGGSVTLDVPATAGTFTVNLPAANGDVVVTGGGSTVQFGPGSVSAPSITFSGDTNTGIYSPAADTIAFTEGGVEGMRIDSAGNVGIGTSSASARLHVVGSSGSAQARLGTTSGYYEVNAFDGNPVYMVVNGANHTSGVIGTQSNTPFVFFTNNTERARITSGGEVLVGTASSVASASIQSVTSNFNVVIRDPGATAGRFWRFDADANNSVIIYNQDGNGVWIGNGGTAWNSSSDETLKNILSPIDEAVASVAKLRAVYFAWKVDEEQKRHPGLIAQDVQRVLPEVVHTDPSGKLSISYTEIIPLLVAAIQEQQAQIETLEARLAAVEAN